jgi:hypothetical protein
MAVYAEKVALSQNGFHSPIYNPDLNGRLIENIPLLFAYYSS